MALALSLTVEEQQAADRLVSLALVEDLRTLGDITGRALIGDARQGTVDIVVRQEGVVAGLPVAALVGAAA